MNCTVNCFHSYARVISKFITLIVYSVFVYIINLFQPFNSSPISALVPFSFQPQWICNPAMKTMMSSVMKKPSQKGKYTIQFWGVRLDIPGDPSVKVGGGGGRGWW